MTTIDRNRRQLLALVGSFLAGMTTACTFPAIARLSKNLEPGGIKSDLPMAADIEPAFVEMRGTFAVVDIETTGLDPQHAEIIELSALLAQPHGSVRAEFGTLVKPQNPIPLHIARITGIAQEDVALRGIPLDAALAAFLGFIGDHPVYVHGAPFATAFIRAAAARIGLTFNSPIHDTLAIARRRWTLRPSYTLHSLAAQIGVELSAHASRSGLHLTLAVLLAARRTARNDLWT